MHQLLSRKQAVGAAVTVLLMSLPFLDKPFHIDDTVVLKVTDSILETPGNPFSGTLDWFGTPLPTWQVTTNPPFLSYYLAPFAWWSDYSEPILHLSMVPFLWMIVAGTLILSHRFAGRHWLPALFVVTSPGIWVSVNVMRDIPALGLGCLGLACFVWGADRKHRAALLWGAVLVGLAVLTKYSAIILLPLLILYLVLQRRFRQLHWVLPVVVLFAGWCLWTGFCYGIPHPYYLWSGDHPGSSLGLWDKFWALLVVLGSTLFLVPVLVGKALLKGRWWVVSVSAVFSALGCGGAVWYHGSGLGGQYLLWVFVGGLLLSLGCARIVLEGLDGKSVEDPVFLLAWMGAPLVFSLVFVPFQAVRHVIPALIPLALIAFRGAGGRNSRALKGVAVAALSLQVVLGLLVSAADFEYAQCYRDFAARASQTWKTDKAHTWFVGHWGWMFYAERAGFRQLHGNQELPPDGDLLLWPKRVHIGRVFSGRADFTDSLELIEERICEAVLPIRTMNFQGAAFYAVVRKNLPYKFQQDVLEEMRVYRVRSVVNER